MMSDIADIAGSVYLSLYICCLCVVVEVEVEGDVVRAVSCPAVLGSPGLMSVSRRSRH